MFVQLSHKISAYKLCEYIHYSFDWTLSSCKINQEFVYVSKWFFTIRNVSVHKTVADCTRQPIASNDFVVSYMILLKNDDDHDDDE